MHGDAKRETDKGGKYKACKREKESEGPKEERC